LSSLTPTKIANAQKEKDRAFNESPRVAYETGKHLKKSQKWRMTRAQKIIDWWQKCTSALSSSTALVEYLKRRKGNTAVR